MREGEIEIEAGGYYGSFMNVPPSQYNKSYTTYIAFFFLYMYLMKQAVVN